MTDQLVEEIVRATFIVKLRGRRYAHHAVLIKRRRGERHVKLTLIRTDTSERLRVNYLESELSDTELRMAAMEMLRKATLLTPERQAVNMDVNREVV